MLDSLFLALELQREPEFLPLPSTPAPLFVQAPEQLAPVVEAKAALAVDLNSSQILFEKNIDEPLPIASLTKLMTALIVRANFTLDQIISINPTATQAPPAKIWLHAYEKLTVRDLLLGLLIRSANDVATAFAAELGQQYFVELMNAKKNQLGLSRTHFSNPAGFDSAENFSTAREVALLAQAFWRDDFLQEIVGKSAATIYSIDGRFRHDFFSTNKLFDSFLDIQGLKTGSTEDAGNCFAGVARLSNGHEILALVLDSPDRFQEVKNILAFFAPK